MYHIIVNKMAGNGKGLRMWKEVEKYLEKKNVTYLVSFTEYAGHAGELIENIEENLVQAVVVVGGDGTIHEVVNKLVHKKVALGIVPAGSGNDLARSLGVPFAVEGALSRILKGSYQLIDVPKVEEVHYISIAGLGFDCKVAEVTNRSRSKRLLNKLGLGGLSYVLNIFRVLFTYQPSDVSIAVDEKIYKFQDVWLIAVANLPYYGGGIMICPDACGNDGALDICVVSGIGRWELLFVFPLAFRGKHIKHRNVKMLRGASIKISPSSSMVMQCDGEIVQNKKADFSVDENALKIF
ncbi:diacylglycerol/lipid kinase family protein [Sutcliffiella horikoshii]|uniref:Diacylglycerol kinase family lipid kinase n=1 Tax=Sutcliffiella horikoshii TaxID=79883 RepID=A0A5D4T956_9BACI|nr:diacylglycerol kinase family protein [Sutcliffiella horikoshii]TYS72217.1 diacylglycerol kinase family lipid kinase [Sutcliffiella horikoshii]